MKKLKVFGGYWMFRYQDKYKQWNIACAAYTKKQAMELLEITSAKYFNDFFCETGNDRALATATEVGVWLMADLNHDMEPVRVK